MTSLNWSNCTVALGDLKPWADNPRFSTKAQAKRILDSFKRFDQVLPIAIGPENEVYDGHQRLSALLTIHGKNYEIDARRSNRALSDDERRALTLAINGGAVGGWNWDALANWDASVLNGEGFDSDMLAELNASAANLAAMLEADKPAPVDDAEPPIDRADELRVKWGIETGQLWQLGEHRLICGDCTDRAVVERVMGGDAADCVFTDPPYGIDYDPRFLAEIAGRHNLRLSSANKVENDDGSLDLSFLFEYKRRFVWGFPYIYDADATGWIVWDKQPGVESRGIVTPIEMASTTMRTGFDMVRVMWGGFYRAAGEDKQPHPTQKPLGVYLPFIERFTKPDEVVFDPFSGSAPVLIACERLGRKCRAIEISPAYVAVALERWSLATGKTPELLDAS